MSDTHHGMSLHMQMRSRLLTGFELSSLLSDRCTPLFSLSSQLPPSTPVSRPPSLSTSTGYAQKRSPPLSFSSATHSPPLSSIPAETARAGTSSRAPPTPHPSVASRRVSFSSSSPSGTPTGRCSCSATSSSRSPIPRGSRAVPPPSSWRSTASSSCSHSRPTARRRPCTAPCRTCCRRSSTSRSDGWPTPRRQ